MAGEAGHDTLAAQVRAHWQQHGRAEKLVMSFHGVPKRTLLLGDPYHCECHKTARLLAQALELKADEWLVTFQSRFGKAEWLQPYTDKTVEALAKSGVKSLAVITPGFPIRIASPGRAWRFAAVCCARSAPLPLPASTRSAPGKARA